MARAQARGRIQRRRFFASFGGARLPVLVARNVCFGYQGNCRGHQTTGLETVARPIVAARNRATSGPEPRSANDGGSGLAFVISTISLEPIQAQTNGSRRRSRPLRYRPYPQGVPPLEWFHRNSQPNTSTVSCSTQRESNAYRFPDRRLIRVTAIVLETAVCKPRGTIILRTIANR